MNLESNEIVSEERRNINMETSFLLECLRYCLRYWDISIAYLLKDSDLCRQ